MEVLKIQSDQHGVLDLTSMVKDIVEKSSVSEGLCCVFVPHTTAGLVIYSGIDPKGLLDLNDTVKTMVPVRTDFHHQCDPPSSPHCLAIRSRLLSMRMNWCSAALSTCIFMSLTGRGNGRYWCR